jgi:hypothetical protein
VVGPVRSGIVVVGRTVVLVLTRRVVAVGAVEGGADAVVGGAVAGGAVVGGTVVTPMICAGAGAADDSQMAATVTTAKPTPAIARRTLG